MPDTFKKLLFVNIVKVASSYRLFFPCIIVFLLVLRQLFFKHTRKAFPLNVM